MIIYRVPPKTRAFRAVRFKKGRSGGFVHILRDADYFEICQHFVTPTELLDYFGFRRDVLVNWDAAAAAVSEEALIGQYLLEDYSSAPDPKFEKAARSRGGPTACEFSFVMETIDIKIAAQADEHADTECYEILTELALLGRYELKALRQELRLGLEAVQRTGSSFRFESQRAAPDAGFSSSPVPTNFAPRDECAREPVARIEARARFTTANRYRNVAEQRVRRHRMDLPGRAQSAQS